MVDAATEKIARKAEAQTRQGTGQGRASTWPRWSGWPPTSTPSMSGPGPSRAAGVPAAAGTQIAAAAVRIADAEGFEAVSMRRLAAELDAGTMTLYHYVRTKDELLALVTDAVMARAVVADRRAARRLARGDARSSPTAPATR